MSSTRPSTTVRTPHAAALRRTLDARDVRYEVLGEDLMVVFDVAGDDLGWIAAGAGVVIYAMVSSTDV